MSMYRFTLAGLYHFDESLFDNMVFPDGADKQNFIDSLILSYGDCEPLYPDFDFMKNSAIPAWSRKWKNSIEKVYDLLEKLEYNPVENYDRQENWTDSPNITRETQLSGTDSNKQTAGQGSTTKQTGTDTNEQKVSAFNSSGYDPSEQDIMTYGNQTQITTSGANTNEFSYGRKDVNTEKGNTEHSGRIHGNIGVTTTQQMMESEMSLRKQSFIDYCTGLFANDLLLLVY
nr:MAG TPA: hypothetical protein [Caudoviricetes sp.]